MGERRRSDAGGRCRHIDLAGLCREHPRKWEDVLPPQSCELLSCYKLVSLLTCTPGLQVAELSECTDSIMITEYVTRLASHPGSFVASGTSWCMSPAQHLRSDVNLS